MQSLGREPLQVSLWRCCLHAGCHASHRVGLDAGLSAGLGVQEHGTASKGHLRCHVGGPA